MPPPAHAAVIDWASMAPEQAKRTMEYVGLLAPLGALAVLAIKLLAVSQEDPQTAYAIISSGSATSMAFGLTLALVPSLLPIAWGMAVRRMLDAAAFDHGQFLPAAAVTLVMWLLLVALVPWYSALVLALVGVAAGCFVWKRNRQAADANDMSRVATMLGSLRTPYWAVIGGIVLLTVLPSMLSPRPWLPSERLTVSGRTVVGYVLSDSAEWVTVLRERDRLVVRYSASDLTRRRLCSVHRRERPRTLPSLLTDAPNYPKC